MSALLTNAAALIDDASLLYENTRYPRAYALAALAGEELGKVYLCLDAVLTDEVHEPKQFWKRWREHGDKLDSARAYAAAFVDDLSALDVDELGPDARRIENPEAVCHIRGLRWGRTTDARPCRPTGCG